MRTVTNFIGFVIYMIWRLFMFTLATSLMPFLLIDGVRQALGKNEIFKSVMTRIASWDPWDPFPWELYRDDK